MAVFLLAPFFLVRFGLLSRLNPAAVKQAAAFAPLKGREQWAYWVYQLANAAFLVALCFLRVRLAPGWLLGAGAAVYGAGLVLLTVSVVDFAAPGGTGLRQTGCYRFSRNPMYVAYFVFFLGCVLLTQSPLLLAFLLVFQAAAHWIIRAEERWCLGEFGEEYRQYRKRVRRYF